MNLSVGTGYSSYEKRIYRAAVSQRLRNTGIVLWPGTGICTPKRKRMFKLVLCPHGITWYELFHTKFFNRAQPTDKKV